MTDTDGSIPDLPEEVSRGSSVSSTFVNEYDEILRYAIVAPKFEVGEDAYRKLNSPAEREESISSSNNESVSDFNERNTVTTAENFKFESKVTKARNAVAMKSKKKMLRFNVPSVSVLDTLLGIYMQCLLTCSKFTL